MSLSLFELHRLKMAQGMTATDAMASALAERARLETGMAPDEAQGTRKQRKQRRAEKAIGGRDG
jgi:hypothetical protein